MRSSSSVVEGHNSRRLGAAAAAVTSRSEPETVLVDLMILRRRLEGDQRTKRLHDRRGSKECSRLAREASGRRTRWLPARAEQMVNVESFPRDSSGSPPIVERGRQRLRSAVRPFTCNRNRALSWSESLGRCFGRNGHCTRKLNHCPTLKRADLCRRNAFVSVGVARRV